MLILVKYIYYKLYNKHLPKHEWNGRYQLQIILFIYSCITFKVIYICMIFWLACLQHNELYICYMYSIHLMYIRCIKLICRAKQKLLRFGITLLKKKIYTPQCGLETIFLFLWCYIDRNRNHILGIVIWFFI